MIVLNYLNDSIEARRVPKDVSTFRLDRTAPGLTAGATRALAGPRNTKLHNLATLYKMPLPPIYKP